MTKADGSLNVTKDAGDDCAVLYSLEIIGLRILGLSSEAGRIMQNHIQQRVMHFEAAVLFDEAQPKRKAPENIPGLSFNVGGDLSRITG